MKNKYIIDNKITNKFVETYTKTTYRVVGEFKHSSIKPCHWFEQRLLTGRENRNCYKGVFGIQSHKCLQNTPSLPFCNHQCVFCWRDMEAGSLGSEFNVEADEPKKIVDEMIRHHRDIVKNHLPLRRYLDNYEIMIDILYYLLKNPKRNHPINSISKKLILSKNKVERAIILLKNQKFVKLSDDLSRNFELEDDIKCCISSRDELETLINRELTHPDDIMKAHTEALKPNHAAISLDGEPLLYPKISEFVQEFKNRNMTTFIVTNGTLTERIKNLDPLPSQLYITLPAPNEQIYKRVCRPMLKNGWQKIMDTLGIINTLSGRTLVRLTAVKDLNLHDKFLEDYYKIIENANPNFFEIKGFTLQAKALLIKERLKSEKELKDYFPEFDYLKNFALKFEKISGFPLIYKNERSRDFLFAVNWDKSSNPKLNNL